MPRCDLLAWILVTKLAPHYYRKLGRMLGDTGRYRELASWRKPFKKEWRELERREVSAKTEDIYRPNVRAWHCTCPYFVTSRFLVCKHLIQLVHPAPTGFFKEAKRARTLPFWRHPKLLPIPEGDVVEREVSGAEGGTSPGVEGMESELEDDDDDDDDDEGEQPSGDGTSNLTFDEDLQEQINLLADFVEGLRYQAQFRDWKFLRLLKKEGGGLFRLAQACLRKEKRLRSTRGQNIRTWDHTGKLAMFYRSRPKPSENDT